MSKEHRQQILKAKRLLEESLNLVELLAGNQRDDAIAKIEAAKDVLSLLAGVSPDDGTPLKIKEH